MTVKKQKPHHHGNLREALVQAGLDLLYEGGPEALTLRKCAARAGVSHAAPAHHFDGLKGLKTAIAARGNRLFAGLMRDGIEAAGSDPKARLLGMCIGYVKFSTEHHALFDLTFAPMNSFVEDKERIEESRMARKILTDTCAPFVHGPANAITTEIAVWSLVHGFSKLIEIGRITPGTDTLQDVRFEEVLPRLNLQLAKDDEPKS